MGNLSEAESPTNFSEDQCSNGHNDTVYREICSCFSALLGLYLPA